VVHVFLGLGRVEMFANELFFIYHFIIFVQEQFMKNIKIILGVFCLSSTPYTKILSEIENMEISLKEGGKWEGIKKNINWVRSKLVQKLKLCARNIQPRFVAN
jgi:hypothetical protein